MKASRRFFLLAVLSGLSLLALGAAAGTAAAFAPYLVPPYVPPPPTAEAAALLKGAGVGAQDGWIVAYLHGRPYRIGFQNGYLTAQSSHYFISCDLGPRGTSYRDRSRTIARRFVWPLVPADLKDELRGVADGMHAAGYPQDSLWDVVAANAWADESVYAKLLPKAGEATAALADAAMTRRIGPARDEHCSAFVATGAATADGKPVMGHNTWSGYDGSFMYNVMFYVRPNHGYQFTYDACGGQVWSGNDWYLNASGLLLCETTISDPVSDPTKRPIFVRARLAAQCASTVGQAVRIFTDSSNGAYANEWLIADGTGRIASLQLGCRAWDLHTTASGFYGSCNYTWGKKILAESHAKLQPEPPRWVRWGQLKTADWGKVDATGGMAMLSDTFDVKLGYDFADARTLCGECENSPTGGVDHGLWAWGAFDGKVSTTTMAQQGLQQWARWGHPNGDGFDAAAFMANNPTFATDYGAFSVFGLETFGAQTPTAWTLMSAK
jgi:hypothetical protein